MKHMVICLMCLFSSMLSAAINEINIIPNATNSISKAVNLVQPFKDRITIPLEIQDQIANASLIIVANKNDKIRASLQLETSMSIQDEGPHLDLLDWKHCTSDWLTLHNTVTHQFKLPGFDNIALDCFPEVTLAEIKQAVLQHDGEEWMPLFDRDSFNKEMNLLIGISAARIKIEQMVEGKWMVVTIVNFNIPIGC
ncbi:hypothetical protein [Psychromonas arctica]|uniref:hypothetical protein n=1 Tax=Psychromonas arctica TaxID=168275 RepID=UPI0004001091|nr:hypothetical protein [Psychromonas arctica]